MIQELNYSEKQVFHFLNDFDCKHISKFLVSPSVMGQMHYTFFYFYVNDGKVIELYYMKNQKIMNIALWEDVTVLGRMSLEEDEKNESKEQWMNDIWQKLVNYFNLRIRLMFINENTSWKWKKEWIWT